MNIELKSLLQTLRQKEIVSRVEIDNFIGRCMTANVPIITIFQSSPISKGWWEMHTAFLFTNKPNPENHIWVFSPRTGLMVFDFNGQNGKLFEEWDKEADLYLDESMVAGGTNIDPVRWMNDCP